jgi:hypothetical protein
MSVCSMLLSDPASRRRPLRFASTSPPSGCEKDFHLRAVMLGTLAVRISVARSPLPGPHGHALPHQALILDEWRQSELGGKSVGRADLELIVPPVVGFAPRSGSLAARDGLEPAATAESTASGTPSITAELLTGWSALMFPVCSQSVPHRWQAQLLLFQFCSQCSQCSWLLKIWQRRKGITSIAVIPGVAEHWELEEPIGKRVGTDWEQDWEHWEHLRLSQPSDTASRGGCFDARGTEPTLVPADSGRHESCPSGSTAPAPC